jgi:uncharacterized protein YbjT (DUF2867 family)
MKVLVAGANGFVGRALMKDLVENGYEIYALVRSKDKAFAKEKGQKIHWLVGDLLEADKLPHLPKIDKAFYLVHGLKEDKASFEYYEALAAVNFVNWLRLSSTPSIIYLGGLGITKDKLSPHLRSRHLTGSILAASGFPTIEFRASIVLGENSLSFEMVKAISERIPFRPDFSLLNQPCQPIALPDLMKYFEASLQLKVEGHKIFEIGAPETTTYGELLDLYSELANLKRKIIKVPEVEIKVLMKALDYSLPELADVGKKLAQSLDFPTVVTNEDAKVAFPEIHPKSLRLAMDLAMADSKTHYKPLWEKDFLKSLLSDKILTQSGLFSPELLRNLERVTKIKDILTRKT